jgi:hypothetical protein
MIETEMILSDTMKYSIIVHSIIIFCLSIYLFQKNSIPNLFIVIVTYLTLYFLFSFISTFGTDLPRIVYTHFHSVGSPIEIKISSIIFLFVLYMVAIYKQRLNIIKLYVAHKNLLVTYLLLLLLFFVALIINNIFTVSPLFELASIELAASFLIWIFSFLTVAILYKENILFVDNKNIYLGVIYLLLTIQLIICTYQIITNSTYSTTMWSIRADGSLFNPNILGLWISFTMLVSSYLYFTKNIDLKNFMLITFYICLLFIMSSSRSMLILILFGLFLISFLVRNDNNNGKIPMRFRFLPIGIFSGLLVTIMMVIKFLHTFFEFFFLKIMALNSERFLNTPFDIFLIAVKQFHKLFFVNLKTYEVKSDEDEGFKLGEGFDEFVKSPPPASGHTEFDESVKSLPPASGYTEFDEFVKSLPPASGHTDRAVSGRFFSDTGADNTYIFIKAIGGWLSLTIWLSLFAVMIYFSVIRYYKIKNINSVYSLVILLSVMLSGLFMRTSQLFPIWVFLSLFMGVSILWIITPLNNNSKTNI